MDSMKKQIKKLFLHFSISGDFGVAQNVLFCNQNIKNKMNIKTLKQ